MIPIGIYLDVEGQRYYIVLSKVNCFARLRVIKASPMRLSSLWFVLLECQE